MTKENWTDIHKDFDDWVWSGAVGGADKSQTWKQEWEKDFTYQEAKDWIEIGFVPDDCSIVNDWKNHGFTSQQTKEWIKLGLKPGKTWTGSDNKFAAYLKWKGCEPSQDLNLEQLREEFTIAQNYLDCFYPKEQRKEVKELELYWKYLKGSLDLSDFVSLEELDCSLNDLTALNLSNCSKLKKLICYNNLLEDLILPLSVEQLTYLDIRKNNLPEQDLSVFSRFVNLQNLEIGNFASQGTGDNRDKISQGIYNRFSGSLEPLQELNKLEKLDISDSDIDSGVEYLPSNVTKVCYSTKERPQSKVKKIEYQLELFVNKELQKKWESLGFINYKEISPWIEIGLSVYEPEFANYLKNQKIGSEIIGNDKITELRKEYYNIEDDRISDKVFEEIKNFKYSWPYENLSAEQRLLINKLIPNLELRQQCKNYGLCKECNQPNTNHNWCKTCDTIHLVQGFDKWTSGNSDIDKFIQTSQLEATTSSEVLEWVPYDQFTEIKYLTEGGFSKIYKAKWIGGLIKDWNTKDSKWDRRGDKNIVLKNLNNSQSMTADLLREISYTKVSDDGVRCLGISQNPETKNYIMIMPYKEGGNLRQYLQNIHHKMSFIERIRRLSGIIGRLKKIHKKGLVHRDFHSGNILNTNQGNQFSYVADLGLCRPVNETNQEKIYGVMPYVAPEVLRSQPYTQASDIYSFGIVAYEMLSGLPPYYNVEHDIQLGVAIYQGLRPKFNIKIPQLLEDLIKRCWDANPKKRPTANELERTLRNWQKELEESSSRWNPKTTEFAKQFQEAEEYNRTLPDEIKHPDYQKKIHSGAVYTSRLLPTKEITELLNKLEIEDLPLDDELKELAREFVRAEQKILANEEVEQARSDIQELNKKLKAKGLAREKIGEIVQYCKEQAKKKEQKKKKLSHESQTKNVQGNPKISKIIETPEYQAEPMEIEQTTSTGITADLSQLSLADWRNIHSSFTPQLIQVWQSHNFTLQETRDWINIHSPSNQHQAIQEPAFYAYLRDEVKLTSEKLLSDNSINLADLKQEYQRWQQSQQFQAQIIHQSWT